MEDDDQIDLLALQAPVWEFKFGDLLGHFVSAVGLALHSSAAHAHTCRSCVGDIDVVASPGLYICSLAYNSYYYVPSEVTAQKS